MPGSVADGEEGGGKVGGDEEGGDKEGSGGSGPRGGGKEREGGRRGACPGRPWGDRGKSKEIDCHAPGGVAISWKVARACMDCFERVLPPAIDAVLLVTFS